MHALEEKNNLSGEVLRIERFDIFTDRYVQKSEEMDSELLPVDLTVTVIAFRLKQIFTAHA